MNKQLSFDNEPGWQHDERLPNVVEIRPELELAWRGLVITVSAGQMTKAEAVEMLRSWDFEGGSDDAA